MCFDIIANPFLVFYRADFTNQQRYLLSFFMEFPNFSTDKFMYVHMYLCTPIFISIFINSLYCLFHTFISLTNWSYRACKSPVLSNKVCNLKYCACTHHKVAQLAIPDVATPSSIATSNFHLLRSSSV